MSLKDFNTKHEPLKFFHPIFIINFYISYVHLEQPCKIELTCSLCYVSFQFKPLELCVCLCSGNMISCSKCNPEYPSSDKTAVQPSYLEMNFVPNGMD